MGVLGLFEDKYGDEVRIVQMGDYTKELCGGTHVENTSNIGLFKISNQYCFWCERIEAITGYEVYRYLNQLEKDLEDISTILKTDKNHLIDKVYSLTEELKRRKKS